MSADEPRAPPPPLQGHSYALSKAATEVAAHHPREQPFQEPPITTSNGFHLINPIKPKKIRQEN